MDRRSTDKRTIIIVAVLIAALVGLVIWSSTANRIDYNQYNLSAVIPADENSGGIEELIEGNPDAPVKIFEYGDYQCTACAPMNPKINALVEEYDGKVAVVFRTEIMDYHQNGTAAASAALAAAKQGYWQEYKDLLFTNQNDWYYSDVQQRQSQFEEYFTKASGGKGDLAQFREDMGSKEVSQKISFDTGMADEKKISWTPTFYVGDVLVSQRDITVEKFLENLRAEIDKQLAEQGIEK